MLWTAARLRSLVGVLLLVALSCAGDDERAGGEGGGEKLSEGVGSLLECRTSNLVASHNPATGGGTGGPQSYTPPGKFVIPQATSAVNPHPSSEVQINFYPVSGTLDACKYRCQVAGGACKDATMHLQSCASGTRSAGDAVLVTSMKLFVNAVGTIPTNHGLISSTLQLDEQGPCPNPCSKVQDNDPCTLDRCVDHGGTFGAVHTSVCGPDDLEPGVATTIFDSLEELLDGANPVQHIVNPSIDEVRAAGITGRVMKPGGTTPAEGIRVTIAGHEAEFGWTETDANGEYVMLVEGGADLVVEVGSQGYLPVQRPVPTRWQGWSMVDEIELTEASLNATRVVIDSQSSAITTVVGDTVAPTGEPALIRTPRLMVAANSNPRLVVNGVAGAVMPAITLRMTEYTVRSDALARMPGPLPASSAYTYALEISSDEAEAAGADGVTFDVPTYFYLDNFLEFPVGTVVPQGRYDRKLRAWVPEDDGVVVGITSGSPRGLDFTGEGNPDPALYATYGVTTAERNALVGYPAGKQLWRVPVTHLSPKDMNWSPWRNATACDPDMCDDVPDDPRVQGELTGQTCEVAGSIVECENQILGERIGLPGTGMTLDYRSDRVPGFAAARTVEVPVTESVVEQSMLAVVVGLEVGGKRDEFRLDCLLADCDTNLRHTFTWDGKDRFGRWLMGRQVGSVTWKYEYTIAWGLPATGGAGRAFGRGGAGGPITTGQVPAALGLSPNRTSVVVGAWDARSFGLGGWSLSAVHAYDPLARAVFYGDGRRRSVDDAEPRVRSPLESLRASDFRVAYRKSGELLYQSANGAIRRLPPGATVSTTILLPVEGGSAPFVRAMVVDDDDRLFLRTHRHIYRFEDTAGTWTRIAGNGQLTGPNEETPCDSAADPLASPMSPDDALAVSDGGVYFTTGNAARICRIAPDGRIYLVAGTGVAGADGDGGAAEVATLQKVFGMAVAPDRSLYFVNGGDTNARIRRIAPDGRVHLVAGGGNERLPSGAAKEARLGRIHAVAVAPDGTVYFTQHIDAVDWAGDTAKVVRAVKDGIVTTVAGRTAPVNCPVITGQYEYCGSGGQIVGDDAGAVKGPARDVRLSDPQSLAVGPDGTVAVGQGAFVALIEPALPGFSLAETNIPSEDGRTVDVFDGRGLHLRTRDVETGIDLVTLGYDSENRVATITDRDGLVTVVDRSTPGIVTVTGPYGHESTLTINSGGWATTVLTPGPTGNERYELGYEISASRAGLLRTFKNPRNPSTQKSTFTYDSLGRLLNDENANLKDLGLARTELPDGRSIDITSPLGRLTTHVIETFADGQVERSDTQPDGTEAVSIRKPDATTTTEFPDGSTVTVHEGADPLWGTLAPYIAKQVVDVPGVGTRTVVTQRAVTGAGATPYDYAAVTDTVWINPAMLNNLPTTASPKFVRIFDKGAKIETWTTPLGRAITRTLNADARTASAGLAGPPPSPAISPVAFTYDNDGRLQLTSQAGPDGTRQTSRTYQSTDGMLDTVTDAAGKVTSFDWDTAARLLSVTRPVVGSTALTYELDGLLKTVTPPSKPAHSFTNGPTDLVTLYTPPVIGGAGATVYAYNDDGDLDLVTLPNGQQIDLIYNATTGQLTSAQRTTTEKVTFGYNAGTGHLETLKGPNWTTSTTSEQTLVRTFNGPYMSTEFSAGAVVGSVGLDRSNPLFQVETEDVVVGLTLSSAAYTYDGDGLVIGTGPLTIERDASTGRIVRTCVGGTAPCTIAQTTEIIEERTYDAYGALASLTYTRNGTVLFDADYVRDALGRIAEKTETVVGTTAVYDYTYDDAGKLTDVHKDNVLVEHYVYQPNGNRTSATNSAGTKVATFDNQDRITAFGSSSVTHNANGEVTSRTTPALTLTRDVFGNLLTAAANGGATQTYVVDALGRRRQDKSGSIVQAKFLWRGDLAPVAQLTSAGVLSKRFIYGTNANVPDVMVDSSGIVHRLIKDHLGSVRLVVRTDTGAVVRRMDFDAYGRKLSTSSGTMNVVPFGFAGGLYDPDTELVRFGARDYDPEMGRWLSKDPARFGGGTNFYEYAASDPINYFDPDGYRVRQIESWYRQNDQRVADFDNAAFYFRDLATRAWNRSEYGNAAWNFTLGGATTLASAFWELDGAIQPLWFGGVTYTPQQQSLIAMAKQYKREGAMSVDDADALMCLAREAKLETRGPEQHMNRNFKDLHIHVGPVDHIKVK